jgi:integrase
VRPRSKIRNEVRPRAANPRATWNAAVRRFATEDLAEAAIGNPWKRRVLYEVGRTPALLRKVGVAVPPSTPARFRARHVDQLKQGLPWSPATFTLHFAALRRLLRWAHNPLAARAAIWSVPAGASGRRRWLAPDQLARLYRAAQGTERVLVALEGFNGLRRVEVLRLRLKDVDFERQRLRVLGKGRNGGKWRTIPMFSETARVLHSVPAGSEENEKVIPISRTSADSVLRRVAERAGFPGLGLRVSHHDLRRTFGRVAHKAGMDLVQLKNLYGHSSLDQTVHYIGLDEDEMRVGLSRFATLMGPLLHPAPATSRRR